MVGDYLSVNDLIVIFTFSLPSAAPDPRTFQENQTNSLFNDFSLKETSVFGYVFLLIFIIFIFIKKFLKCHKF